MSAAAFRASSMAQEPMLACMQANESGASPKVLGLGSLGLDYLATVSHFPEPDEKMRTEELEVSRCSHVSQLG